MNPLRFAKLTLSFVRKELAPLGVTVAKKDGEFKVRLKGSPAGNGYFTTDLQDALDTGKHMSQRSKSARLDAFERENKTFRPFC